MSDLRMGMSHELKPTKDMVAYLHAVHERSPGCDPPFQLTGQHGPVAPVGVLLVREGLLGVAR